MKGSLIIISFLLLARCVEFIIDSIRLYAKQFKLLCPMRINVQCGHQRGK